MAALVTIASLKQVYSPIPSRIHLSQYISISNIMTYIQCNVIGQWPVYPYMKYQNKTKQNKIKLNLI